jgi:hypothetical protein
VFGVFYIPHSSLHTRFSTLHAGSENGFLDNAFLVYEDGAVTGDYHGQLNGTKFEKWDHEKVTLNLPSAF